jgi:hypothetical protein
MIPGCAIDALCRSDAKTLENMEILAYRRNEPPKTVTRFTRFASLCRWRGRYACPQS